MKNKIIAILVLIVMGFTTYTVFTMDKNTYYASPRGQEEIREAKEELEAKEVKKPSKKGDISEKTGKPKTTWVKGYTKKDGTKVEGYWRS